MLKQSHNKTEQNRKNIIFILLFLTVCLCFTLIQSACVSTETTPPAPTSPPTPLARIKGDAVLWQSFEKDLNWFAVKNSWNDNDSSLGAEQSKEWASDGKYSLECTFEMNGKNGAAFFVEKFDNRDWRSYTGIAADFNNTAGAGLVVAVALCTGPEWLWQESPGVMLKPGVNQNVQYSFYTNTLKSALTQWQLKGSLAGAEDIKRVVFKFYASRGFKGKAFIDNIRLIKVESGEITEGKQKMYSPFPDNEGKDKERLAFFSVTDNLVNGTTPCFSLLELSIELDAWIGNPYDPEDTKVYTLFRDPDGNEQQIQGFFFVPYNREVKGRQEILTQSGDGYWKIRFTPRTSGKWQYMVKTVQGKKEAAFEWKNFIVKENKNPGFISRKYQTGRYFKFESGMTYLPIGSNVSWYDRRGMVAYETWFSKMAENGANYARIWFAPWGFAQEWMDTGPGDYARRQKQAWQLDYLLELAEKYNIYLMLCLIDHGQFSTGTNPKWGQNPYNIRNGGMLDNPWEFLTNPEAKKLFKRRLRYIISRWGYSTHIFSWEFWNEINLADNMYDPETLIPWIREMTGYIEKIDPYDHLISNSNNVAVKGDEPEWQYLDYLQIHKYNVENWAPYLNNTILKILDVADKPLLVGEFGIQGDFVDPMGIHFHNGMWAALFSGAAGTSMLWWWDTYIEPNNLYYHYKGISGFFKEEASAIGEMNPIKRERQEKVNVYSLKSEKRILYWVQDKKYSYSGFIDKAFGVGLDNVSYSEIKGVTLELENILPGLYRIEQWDTETGKLLIVKEKEYTDSAKVELQAFIKDTALKVIKID